MESCRHPNRQWSPFTSIKFKVERERRERETQISNQTCLCFLMLIQTEVQWLEIIEMRQMSRDAAKTATSQQQ
jgi:hypothetical protein